MSTSVPSIQDRGAVRKTLSPSVSTRCSSQRRAARNSAARTSTIGSDASTSDPVCAPCNAFASRESHGADAVYTIRPIQLAFVRTGSAGSLETRNRSVLGSGERREGIAAVVGGEQFGEEVE